MYHDQGLPVVKHEGFGNAVNVTLGLPIVRTSVDHGTALLAAAYPVNRRGEPPSRRVAGRDNNNFLHLKHRGDEATQVLRASVTGAARLHAPNAVNIAVMPTMRI